MDIARKGSITATNDARGNDGTGWDTRRVNSLPFIERGRSGSRMGNVQILARAVDGTGAVAVDGIVAPRLPSSTFRPSLDG